MDGYSKFSFLIAQAYPN